MIKNLIHSNLVCPDLDKDYPIITHGEGVYLFDQDGKKYIDGTAGSAAVAGLGHSVKGISDIAKLQMDKIAAIPTFAFRSKELEDYLAKLVSFSPEGFDRAWTATSGTEAVEQAMKLALQYHQLRGDQNRFKIISRWGSYHGNSIFTLDVGGMVSRRNSYSKWMNNFPHLPASFIYRRPIGMTEEEYTNQSLAEFEKCVIEAGPETIAAFIAEPVVGATLGAVSPVDGYYQEIRRVCDKYGILMISDEVFTGFGRLGTNFGIQKFNVIPDIIATAKGMGAGYFPLSAIITHQKVSSEFVKHKATFLGGHTFACNPVGAAVGSFVIDYFDENKIVENSFKMGEVFKSKLQRLYRHSIVGDVRGTGLLLAIELVADKNTKIPFAKELGISKIIFDKAFSKGVLIYPGKGTYDGVSGDHIVMCPPLIINEAQIEEMVHVIDESIQELCSELQELEILETVR